MRDERFEASKWLAVLVQPIIPLLFHDYLSQCQRHQMEGLLATVTDQLL
jgi:hypothetical protein